MLKKQYNKPIKICIDAGNTAIKVAVFDADDLLYFESFLTVNSDAILHIINQYGVQKGIVSSVLGDITEFSFLKDVLLCVVFLDSQTAVPFVNNYETYQTLGPDRIALASAAVKLFPQKNVLVIDAGTCITYDFIDSLGVFQGGSISPGVQMRFKALHQFTAKLPLFLEKDFDISNFVGKNTKNCILSGVFTGVVCEVEQVIHRYKSICENLNVVLTGGNGVFLHKNLTNSTFLQPHFLLQGLNVILDNHQLYE